MHRLLIAVGLLLVVAVPTMASAILPRPVEVEVIDVPNDDGTGLGILWYWEGAFPETATVTIEVELADEVVAAYALSAEQMQRLLDARAWLLEQLGPILPEMYATDVALSNLRGQLAEANKEKDPSTPQIRQEYWRVQNENAKLRSQRDDLWTVFSSKVTVHGESLFEMDQDASYLGATLNDSPWITADPPAVHPGATTNARGVRSDTKEAASHRFGQNPTEPDKFYLEINSIIAWNPAVFAGTYTREPDETDYPAPSRTLLPLERNRLYNLRMIVKDGDESTIYELAGGTPQVNYFNTAFLNNLFFALGFAVIILLAIMIARRNPNMFIRRISGLEAVDEAIGRATEMGKPVLYLCGLDSLATLSTLAAVNILGRVARRIADYDSDLIVPHRDPIVLTVAQEVVREAYIDQGRPDAYKEDNIFFVTDDQFSFTATTCAIMMRDKPAANFFMGYYYAESLLLAETGASTGAIQIAGTDALHQLPFFITTCDYTLIGEELYAASAYLSREPMLLGSLKGQDLGKALIMALIVIQTLLFIFSPEWDWLKSLVEAL